jgi:hypothetical protein
MDLAIGSAGGPRWTPAFDTTAAPAAPAPDFDAEVRGIAAKPIDLELARLAQDVYQVHDGAPPGWHRLSAAELAAAGIDPAQMEDKTTGLRAALYQDGEGRTVLAYVGSNDIPDWLNNLAQGVGLDAAQYRQAVALAKDAKLAFGDRLAITGHSLGGGLAAAGSIATGSAAVTFNAAGVSDETFRRIGLDPDAARQVAAAGQVRRYAVDGEILTEMQQHVPLVKSLMPDAPGHEIDLPAPPLHDDFGGGIDLRHRIGLGLQWAARPVTLHLMDAVLQSLQGTRPWLH